MKKIRTAHGQPLIGRPALSGRIGRSPTSLYSGHDAARFLRMSYGHLKALHVRGDGPHYYNVSGVVFFDVYDLQAFKCKKPTRTRSNKEVRHVH